MAIIERDIVLQGKTADGNRTIDLPVTALKNIEDTAEIKEKPTADDYIPVIDSADGGQMKKTPFSFMDVLGKKSKNLLRTTAESETKRGVTFTVNPDGSVTANGTAEEDITFYITTEILNGFLEKDGNYILSGCINGSAETYELRYYNSNSCPNPVRLRDGETEINHVSNANFNFAVAICKGVTVSDVTFYPMVRTPEIEDSTYESYETDLIGKVEFLSTIATKCMINRTAISGGQGGDLNTALESGIYRYYGKPLNAPNVTVSDYGILLVLRYPPYIVQFAFSYLNSTANSGAFFRGSTNTGEGFQPWKKFAFTE